MEEAVRRSRKQDGMKISVEESYIWPTRWQQGGLNHRGQFGIGRSTGSLRESRGTVVVPQTACHTCGNSGGRRVAVFRGRVLCYRAFAGLDGAS